MIVISPLGNTSNAFESSTHPISGDLEDPISSGPGQVLLQLRLEDYHSAVCCWVDSGCGHGCGPAWALRHDLLPHLNSERQGIAGRSLAQLIGTGCWGVGWGPLCKLLLPFFIPLQLQKRKMQSEGWEEAAQALDVSGLFLRMLYSFLGRGQRESLAPASTVRRLLP